MALPKTGRVLGSSQSTRAIAAVMTAISGIPMVIADHHSRVASGGKRGSTISRVFKAAPPARRESLADYMPATLRLSQLIADADCRS